MLDCCKSEIPQIHLEKLTSESLSAGLKYDRTNECPLHERDGLAVMRQEAAASLEAMKRNKEISVDPSKAAEWYTKGFSPWKR